MVFLPLSLLLQQHIFNYHLLQNHFLLPSLLLSLNFPSSPDDFPGWPTGGKFDPKSLEADNSTRVWPSRKKRDRYFLRAVDNFPEKQDIGMSVMANQLAIAQLSQVVMDLLGPAHNFLTSHPDLTPRPPPSVEDVDAVLSAIQKNAAATASDQNTAHPGQFPWLVSIQASNFYNLEVHLCGGALISASWVLTVAHCLDGERPSLLEVVAGEFDMRRVEGTEQRLRVAKVIQHPQYNYTQRPFKNDVALLLLAEPVMTTKYTQVAALPSRGFDSATVGECREAGWGARDEGAPGTKVLMFADVPLLPHQQCQAIYPTVDEQELCAGAEGIGSCAGDHGGLLVCVTADGNTLSGVMSWRESCAQVGKPAVYMDVGKYLPWIRNTTDL